MCSPCTALWWRLAIQVLNLAIFCAAAYQLSTVSTGISHNVASLNVLAFFFSSGHQTKLVLSSYSRGLSSDLKFMVTGQSERTLSDIFKWAENLDTCLIFLDDIDCLATSRG